MKRLKKYFFRSIRVFFPLFLIAQLLVVNTLPVFALNDTTKTWSFTAATAGDYTYDSTLVTVDNSGAYPVANKLTNPAFASDNSSWSVAANPPSGWVEVPGDSNFNTTNFLAMKYEAKCAATSDPATGLTSPDTSSVHTYTDSTTACTSANSKQVVSVASGYPIANISHTNALTRCSAVSVGSTTAHLMRNDEWMSVARNAEAQAGNWTGGSVGSGYLYAGHNDNAPVLALVASTTDTGNNACAYTDTAGTTEAPTSCPTNTSSGQSGTAGNQKRVFTLSNGAYIWDIAGNVWEHVQRSTDNAGDATTTMALPACSNSTAAFEWCQYGSTTTPYVSAWSSDVALAKVGSATTSYNSSQGMGQVYTYGTGANQSTTVFLRGGYWNLTANTGAFTLYLSWTASATNNVVGFRCASDPVAISQSFSSSSGRAGGGNTVTIGSVSDGKIYQSVNVGDTSTYDFSVYVYDTTAGNDGGTVTSSIAQLYYNGATISTTYTDAGSGWWKLSGTLTGANASRDYGVLVKAGKTVKVDDFTLSKQGTYSVYNTSAYSNTQINTWDTFCEGTLSGSTCTTDSTSTGNAAIKYQLCADDGSTCQSGSSWKYWTGSAWASATDTTTTVNTAAQLTQSAMQALPITSQKISVKAIFTFGGSDTPYLPHISIGLTSAPSSINLDSPADNSYTNSERPAFKWKGTSDAASGLSKYVLEIDNPSAGSGQPSGDFTLESIPASRTTDYETNKYVSHYENFSDSDSTNDYISAYTKSSTDWSTDSNSGQNDGKLREGKVGWKVKAVNNAGGETSSSRTLFVDRTGPKVEFSQVNDTQFSSSTFSTTDKTPTIYGKITDPLAGGDSSQTQDENGPKIASGPKNVEIKMEKKNVFGFYDLHTLATITINDLSWASDGSAITDNSQNKADKYSTFSFTPGEALSEGSYKITVTGKDKADNTGSPFTFNLTVTGRQEVTVRPVASPSPVISPQVQTSPQPQAVEVEPPSALERTTSVIPDLIGNLYRSVTSWIPAFAGMTKETVEIIGESIQIAASSASGGFLAMTNNIGQGISNTAKSVGDGYNRLATNAPGMIKPVLTGIGNGVLTMVTTTISLAQQSREIAAGFALAMTNTIKSGIANVTFTIGEKAQDVSGTVGIAIMKFGSQFVTEPTRISEVQAVTIFPTSVKVSWTTNHPANGKVNWGFKDGIYEFEEQTDKRTTQHEFILTNLKPDTEYHYEVMSHNKNYVYDANRKFRTPVEQ